MAAGSDNGAPDVSHRSQQAHRDLTPGLDSLRASRYAADAVRSNKRAYDARAALEWGRNEPVTDLTEPDTQKLVLAHRRVDATGHGGHSGRVGVGGASELRLDDWPDEELTCDDRRHGVAWDSDDGFVQ